MIGSGEVAAKEWRSSGEVMAKWYWSGEVAAKLQIFFYMGAGAANPIEWDTDSILI